MVAGAIPSRAGPPSGGDVVGVIPEALVSREAAHASLPDLRVVPSMHARKSTMAESPDELLERFAAWRPATVDKWLDRAAR